MLPGPTVEEPRLQFPVSPCSFFFSYFSKVTSVYSPYVWWSPARFFFLVSVLEPLSFPLVRFATSKFVDGLLWPCWVRGRHVRLCLFRE